MPTTTIAVIGTGDMGSAVGQVLSAAGFRIVTDLSGRSEHSRRLAQAAGIEDLGGLEAVASEAALILSILPPAAALEFAGDMAAAIRAAGARPCFADCNAVSPEMARRIGSTVTEAGATFVDVGIVGRAPKAGGTPARFYVSGSNAEVLEDLAGPQIRVLNIGAEPGRASALKMAYASMNKGTDALYLAVLLAAERLGVRPELMEEIEASQPAVARRMHARIPYLAADAGRYVGEMLQIMATYESVGVTPGFHSGAAWVFEQIAATSLGQEKRATLPDERSLDAAIEVFTAAIR